MRVGVLISGGGTNLQSLIDHATLAGRPYEVVSVISNRADAGGLERADRHGIPGRFIERRGFATVESFEAVIDQELRAHGAEFVCLAGYMRILSPWFVKKWHNRLLNIHPSLLPAFPGLHTHRRVLDDGCRVSGCTVHFVRSELDSGPILVQGVVPVMPQDDAASLAARVLEVEHRCYPRALSLYASGRLTIEGDDITLANEAPGDRLILHPKLTKIQS
ncbi:MAG: phosphoribosylglycinamide formyltransferase [Pseudomonadota bacterium]